MSDKAALNADEARIRVKTLIADLRTLKEMDALVIAAMPALEQDLTAIDFSLAQNPERFRLVRSFLVVHAPSLQTAMWLTIKAASAGAMTKDLRAEIMPNFTRAAQLVTQARERLNDATIHELQVELSVLAERAPQLLEVEPSEPEQAGLFSRLVPAALRSSASRVAVITAEYARKSKEMVYDNVMDGTGWALAAVWRIPSYGANWTKEGLEHLGQAVLDPVTVRLTAAQHGLMSGAAAGVGIGVITAILCPPLLPFAALPAALEAIDGYNRGLIEAKRLKGRDREARLTELAVEREQILKEISGGADSFQVDTGLLNVTVDTRTGAISRIITDGEHVGRKLEDLSANERADLLAAMDNANPAPSL